MAPWPGQRLPPKPHKKRVDWMCSACERFWTGTVQAHCTVCHQHFSTANVFDMHRRGRGDDRDCVYPGDVTNAAGVPRMRQVQSKHGMTWVSSDPKVNLEVWQKADAHGGKGT